ncbi:hypothetical protein C5167_027580 [Papaver somniferum]|nr:hypothetical protein C5167_027580 [Papaver somniferum]
MNKPAVLDVGGGVIEIEMSRSHHMDLRNGSSTRSTTTSGGIETEEYSFHGFELRIKARVSSSS